MTVLLGAAPSIIGPSEVGAWMAAKGAAGAAALLDFAGQKYGLRSPDGVPRWGSVASDMIFSRASTGGRLPALGAYEMVASGVPRFDHDPVTRAPRGVLIEAPTAPLSTNTANISAWLTGGGWPSVVNRTSLFSGGVAQEFSAPSNSFKYQFNYILAASTNYRVDAIVELGAAAPPNFLMGFYRGAWVSSSYFYWNGTYGAGPGALASSGQVVENLGTGPNGGQMYRFSCVLPSGDGGGTSFYLYPTGSTGSVAGQSVIVHYASCTPGTLYHSPSIIGVSAQTRAADSLTMAAPIVPANGFTVAFRARMPRVSNSGDSNVLFNLMPAASTANRIGIDSFGGVGQVWMGFPGGVGTYRLALGVALGSEFHGAFAWSAARGWRGTALGGAVVTVTAQPGPVADLARMTIGSRAGAAPWGSTIKRIDLWPHGDFSDDQMRGLLAA